MSNEIEEDFNDLADQIEEKVIGAIKLLNEAKAIADKAGIRLPSHDDWSDLREVMELFTPTKTPSWDQSTWCQEEWNDSGCSY